MNLIEIFNSIISESKNLPSGGNCFDSSYDYIISNGRDNPDLVLVHGFVSGQGKLKGLRYAHGWCEDDDVVIDVSNGRDIHLPKELYYIIGEIDPNECKYYSYKEVLEISHKHEHKGPWDIKNKHYRK